MATLLRYFYLLPILGLFLTAFGFFAPGLGKIFRYTSFLLYITIILFMVFDGKAFVNTLVNVVKKTPLKILLLALTLILINSLFLSFIGITSFKTTILFFLDKIVFGMSLAYIYYIFLTTRYFSIYKLLKIILLLLWIYLIIGFITYIADLFNITILINIVDFFSNTRAIAFENLGYSDKTSGYVAYGLPRLDNLMEEPGYYAQFLMILLPIVYSFLERRLHIVRNKQWNFIINKTFIPFMWLSIILTMSPIFLILCILFTAIFYFKKIIILLKKYSIFLIIGFLVFCFVLINIDLSQTYLNRIIKVFTNLRSFDTFIYAEQSFATRIVSYINQFCLFLQHPLTGCGYGNLSKAIYEQLLHSPVPLTPEIIDRTRLYLLNGVNQGFTNRGFISCLLAENGIIITSIVIYFYYRVYRMLTLIYYRTVNPIDKQIIRAFKGVLLVFLMLSWYNLSFVGPMNVYLALMVSFIYQFKLTYKSALYKSSDLTNIKVIHKKE